MFTFLFNRWFLLIAWVLTLVVLGLFYVQGCKDKAQYRSEREGWITYNSTLQNEYMGRGREIGKLKVQVIKDPKAEKQLAKADSGFSSIQTIVKWKTRYLPPPATAKAVGRDTVPINSPSGLCWPVGTRFELVDSWRGIFARLDSNGLRDSGSYFIARPEVVIGQRERAWPSRWFVRPEITATFRDLNPYVHYEGGQAIQVQPAPIPILGNPWVTFGLGSLAGYGVGRIQQANKK